MMEDIGFFQEAKVVRGEDWISSLFKCLRKIVRKRIRKLRYKQIEETIYSNHYRNL